MAAPAALRAPKRPAVQTVPWADMVVRAARAAGAAGAAPVDPVAVVLVVRF